MNWRYRVGAAASSVRHSVLACRALPLSRYVRHGSSWLYDAQRFATTRRLDVVFDAGANVGQTALAMTRYLPDATIYSFEPVAATYGRLTERTKRVPNIRCVHAALGAEVGSAVVRLRSDSELNSLASSDVAVVEQSDRLESDRLESVAVTTVDAFCGEQGIDAIDVLKMDVQGFESNVLRGAEGMLAHNRIRFVYSEVGFCRDDREMQPFADLDDLLQQKGFRLCGFYEPFRWGPRKQYLGFCNALYVNPAFARPATEPAASS